MPDLSGGDVYATVREQLPQFSGRFVFMSGTAFTERSRAFLDTIDNPVLEKPFAPKELFALLDAHLDAVGPRRRG